MPPRTMNGLNSKKKKKKTNLPSSSSNSPSEIRGDERGETCAPSDSQEPKEEVEPIQPLKFFFDHTEYKDSCKLSTKCDDSKTLSLLEEKLSEDERRWFSEHPQFKHIWHKQRSPNHKVQGIWMLFLRTVEVDKENECWFVVNGVPVRYSLREHGLLSGLNCHRLPQNHEQLGSFAFVDRCFGRRSKITTSDVENKVSSMRACGDRLKMAVLLFLSKIISGQKRAGSIDNFTLRIVNDLEMVGEFPWGRLTYENAIHDVYHLMKRSNRKVKPTWCFPGFIIPLELLAFECIPDLKKQFREDVITANGDCPRMCKGKWKDYYKIIIQCNEFLVHMRNPRFYILR